MISSLGFAQESDNTKPYVFGGACQSQGSWTADALSATSSLQNIAEQLKNDKNCNSLAKKLDQHYAELQPRMIDLGANAETANKLSSISEDGMAIGSLVKEGSGIKDFLMGSSQFRNQVTSLVAKNLLETKMTNASLNAFGPAGTSAAAIIGTSKRIRNAAYSSLDTATNVLDSLITESQCLSSSNMAGPIISAMVSVASSVVTSRQDSFGQRTARFVNKLSMFMRDRRFAGVFNKLNQIQFRNSLSCLLEVTSESYCSTLDARTLYDTFMSKNIIKEDGKGDFSAAKQKVISGISDSPLQGLYILTQQIPIVTAWLEKVQRGVEPMLKTDASQKNETITTTMQFFLKENILLSYINSEKKTLEALPRSNDDSAQKNQITKIILGLSDIIIGSNFAPNAQEEQNFFTTSSSALLVPFRLMGITPNERVTGEDGSVTPLDFRTWVQGAGRKHPVFKNPMQLAQNVEKNLRLIIEEAKGYAVSYYNNWYIYDQPGLFVDSLTNVRYNVREVLVNVRTYLSDLFEQVQNDELKDASVLSTIIETKDRINNILAKYNQLTEVGKKLKIEKNPTEIDALKKEGAQLHMNIIKTIYENFSVYIARSGFLSNRLTAIVKFDIQNLVRLSEKDPIRNQALLRQIFFATGEAAFENMRIMSGGNPTMINLDISNAQVTQLQNISALEALIKDYFLENIKQMKLSAEAKPSVDLLDTLDFEQKPLESKNSYSRLKKIQSYFWFPLFEKLGKSANSYFKSTSSDKNNDLTEFQAAKTMHKLYCIQSLTFADWRSFKPLCKGVILESDFKSDNLSPATKQKFENLLNVSYDKKLSAYVSANMSQNDVQLNRAERICAFRQYARNNYIMYLTLGLQTSN